MHEMYLDIEVAQVGDEASCNQHIAHYIDERIIQVSGDLAPA